MIVYVVIKSWDSYGEYDESIVGIFKTHQEAQNYIDAQKRKRGIEYTIEEHEIKE